MEQLDYNLLFRWFVASIGGHGVPKTDRLDVVSLVRLLIRYVGGEAWVMSVVSVPSEEQEDCGRLHRERERLLKERTMHRNRMRSLLVAQGIDEVKGNFGGSHR